MISLNRVVKTVASGRLFEVEALRIHENRKIALIGDNGVGKTTFLKMLAGLDKEYSGSVSVHTSIDYFFNDMDEEYIARAYGSASGACEKPYSPGQYQYRRLENILSKEKSFLLIDEPTSHLDIEKKDELVRRLQTREKGFIVISHDRDFISKTCDEIFELVNGRVEIFNGDYGFYLDEKVKRDKFAKKEYAHYVSEKKRLEKLAVDIQEQSRAVRTTPKRMGNSEARLHKMGGQQNKKKLDKQARAVASKLQQLEIKEKPKESLPIKLTIPEIEKLHAKILIRAEHLDKKFDDKLIFQEAAFAIENESKIALLGPNGSGKTTLLRMIREQDNIWVHPKLNIGYYSQTEDMLDISRNILDNLTDTSIYDETMTRIILSRLGFKQDDVYKKVAVLSDGERAKVKLAKLLTADFNYLILDEPTNFLDIKALESLEAFLKAYDRPCLFVTHDVAFINHIATSILMIKDKKIIDFKGNLEAYHKSHKKISTDDRRTGDSLLRDFRISAINARLSMDIPEKERLALTAAYNDLIKMKKK